MEESASEGSPADVRLDEIATQWSLLRLAHRDTVTAAGPARGALVLRYNKAIRGYVGALVRDEHDADEVAQEALIKVLRGDFAGATPERGRFRDLLKVAIKNLVRGYWGRQKRRKDTPGVDVQHMAVAEANDEPEVESAWLATWRNSVLELAWEALERYQQSVPGNISYTLLRLRAAHPDDSVETLAERLAESGGGHLRGDAVRQQLRRARLRFAQLLLEEVARSLDEPNPTRVEEELIDLGLMEHVRDFLPADWRTKGELRE
jgi:DNA-directed RNA polymerase specialized sigma24 family protein